MRGLEWPRIQSGMLTLALAVTLSSSQLTPFSPPPMVPAFDVAVAPAPVNMTWRVLDTVAGSLVVGMAGMKLGGMTRNGDMSSYLPDMAGAALGGALGFVGGYVLSHFAMQGNTAARIASVVLWGMGLGALGAEGYKIYSDVSAWCARPKSFSWGW
jgi:hypothetical protein